MKKSIPEKNSTGGARLRSHREAFEEEAGGERAEEDRINGSQAIKRIIRIAESQSP